MRKFYRSLLWSGVVVAGVAACGDDVTILPPPPPPPPSQTVHSISVAPNGVTIQHPGTQQMTAAVNADVGVATTVTWSAAPASVATINATGLLTTVGPGNVAIQACSTVVTSVCGVATITVSTLPPATVTQVLVTPANPSIPRPVVGSATLQLNAAVIGTNNPSQNVTWSVATGGLGATVTVSETGLVTITSAAAAGTVNIQACSTVAGFTNVCGTSAIVIGIPTPATVSIQSVTWVPQTAGTCAVIAGGVSQPVVLTAVMCQIEVTANVNAGDQVLSRLDILIGGQVVASQTFPGTVIANEEDASVSAPVDITQSVNTRQLKDAGTNKIPVIFNGNQAITALLYVAGGAAPVAAPAVPVVMNNLDVFFVAPGIGTGALTPTSSTPSVTVGGATFFTGTQTVVGNFIAYSDLTGPSAFTFSASTLCGAPVAVPAGTNLSGTPTTGIVVTGTFTCAGVEGQNFLGAAPASVLTYPTATGPDGTVLATVGTLTYVNVGSAYQVPIDAAGTLEARYNPIVLAGTPSSFVDNKGPTTDIASSTSLLFTGVGSPPAVAGSRAVAFNGLFDQWWVNGSFALANCSPMATCATSGYLQAIDLGVGLAAGFPVARLVVAGVSGTPPVATDFCTGTQLPLGGSVAGLSETVTSSAPDGYRACTYAEDLLGNASPTNLGAPSVLQPSNATNKSNRFGLDTGAPVLRFLGAGGAAPAPAGTPSTVSATANTTIYSIAAPRPAHFFGIEAQDTRSGFHQGAAIAGLPATHRYRRATAAGVTTPCTPAGSLATLLSDTWVRSVETDIACGLAGAAGVGYWAYSAFVTDRAGNVSAILARNYAADDVAPPSITGLGFAAALYTPATAAPFGFSANDDVEIIDATLGVVQYMNNAGLGVGILRYPPGSLTPLGARFDVDCTLLQPNCVFTSVLNGAVSSIPYFIFRVDEACTAAATPYASCTAPGTIATPPAGAPPAPPAVAPYYFAPVAKTAADYTTAPHPTTNAGYLPTLVSANVNDVASQLAGAPITAPMLGTQFSPAAGLAAPWAAADILSWSGTAVTPAPGPPPIAGGLTAVHVASTSIQVPLFDYVAAWRLNDLDVSGTITAGDEWVFCGTFPAPTLTDNGFNRFWTYNTAYPIPPSPCADGAMANPAFRPFRVGGAVGGAMIMTPNF